MYDWYTIKIVLVMDLYKSDVASIIIKKKYIYIYSHLIDLII
jgi:hypothetical protein